MAATLVGDLNDPEYRNWYKANRALLCTIDVLRHVCFAEMQNFHNSLVHKHGRRTCNGPCTHTDVVAHGQWGSWSLQCPSNVCSQWLTDITRKSAKTSTRLIWQNSDFSQWQTEPWQIAKIYMNRGQEKTCVKPDDTDAAGVLQLLMNFKGFQNVLDTAKVDAVRKKRNALMHSHNMKVSDTDLAIYIQTMVDLLEDPVKLLQDPAAQQAVTDITMIESTVIEVKDSAFLVQERMVWKQHLASLADANKQEILKLVSNNAKLANRLRGQEKRLDEMTEEKEHVNGLRRKEIIRNIGFLTATCFLLAAALWLRHTENIHGNQWIQQTTINIILIFWVALVVPVVLIGRIKGTDNAWLTAVIVIWITLGLPFLLPQMETYRIQDELQQWRLHLRDAQRRSLELYILKKNEDEGMSFQNLSDIYVELRMVSTSDHYKRLETRTRYGNLNLMMQTAAYPKINVTDLFVAKRPEMTTPVRSLLTGSAGIGKTSLCLHIIEQWLKGELLPLDIHHVFLIHLRYLTGNNTCSIEDLFFKYQPCTRPGDEAIGEFFKQLFADPDKTLLILDGWDEIKTETTEKQYVYDHNEQVDMPRLVASIINRSNIPSVRVLVTSRPRGVTNFYTYDKKAEIYGFTQETISDYIVKFSGEDHNLQMSINDYIDANVNINSFCYIPVQLNMVCRIVKDKMHHKNNPELPETFTELSVAAVENMLIYHHPDFKYQHLDETVNVIANLKEYVLNHARIARYGLEQSPIKIMFTKKDVHLFQLDNVTMKYGLMTESSESGTVTYKRNVASVFYFQHLTLQELLAAVALLADINQVENMMSRASDRQLDVMLVFMAGLLGNNRTYPFLDALQLKRIANLDKFIKLVVDLEQRNVASIQNEEDRSTAHKSSTFFLVMLLYESRQVQLWRHMSKYILKNNSILDLSGYIISPTELHALVYVLPETRCISSLILADCGLTGTEAVNLLRVLRHLPVLTELNLQNNHDLHGSEMTAALTDSLVHLTQLEGIQLDGCGLTDEDIARLTASLAHLRKLSILWLNGNSITNVGALKLTTVAVKLPYLESLGLFFNWLTKDGTDGVRWAVRSTPRVRLDMLDLQRPPGEELLESSTVVNVQRVVDMIQSALSRLRGRPLKDRDSNWDEDVADVQRLLVSTEDKLRVTRMTQVTNDFLRLSSDLSEIQRQLYVSLAAKPDEEFPADLVVKWQRLMDQTKSALNLLQDSYWGWDVATKQNLLERQRMLEWDEYRLRLTLCVVRMTQLQVTQALARIAQYQLDISLTLRDTNVELQRVKDQLQPIMSRLLEQSQEEKDSSWDEDVADMRRMLDHRCKILVLFITQVTQDLTRFTQDLVRIEHQPYVLLAARPGKEFLTVQAWQHYVDSNQSFLSMLQDSSCGWDVATIQRILEAQRELDRAQEVLRLALSGQDSQQ